ncbi:MAG: DNA polymerase I [Burkholderiales bacterium]|nr:DNA polymerase I [Burkholderiales bacterium]MDQ3195935.1 DNA polymerase I [Pseudomonadota bacterium]
MKSPAAKTLLLVDGSSYLYRAYHALPDLRTRQDEPTGAIYGVINMLRKLRTDVPADYIACVFDAKGKTFRDDLYPAYKATRAPMMDDLARQIEPLNECIRALGWPLLTIDGVEADDVIGTLACEAERVGVRTVISTGDKDFAQLVNAHIGVVNTMSNETLDEASVLAKFGVAPTRFLDYLALIGDAIDNVPGVAKVGPKTAAKWLAQYGSLDGVIAHADEISGQVGDNLRAARDWLPRAREILTIKRNVALPLGLANLVAAAPDTTRLAALYERFEFKTWRRELESSGLRVQEPRDLAPPAGVPEIVQSVSAPREKHYETILTEAQFERWFDNIRRADLVTFDTSAGSNSQPARLVGLSFAISAGEAAYLPLAHDYPGAPQQLDRDQTLAKIKPWLEDPARPKLGHNLKYDAHVLADHGITLRGAAHDTLLQSYVLESHRPHDLDNLAHRHLNWKTLTYAEVVGKGLSAIDFGQVALDRATEYAAEDVDVALQLHAILHPRVAAAGLLAVYRDIEMRLLPVLFAMERTGVLIDAALLDAQSAELGAKMLAAESEAHRLAEQPFNLNSPKQIQEILFDKLRIPVIKKTPGGTPSTDEDVLQQLALHYPLPKLLLEYRGLSKLKSTYTDKLPRMVNAATGRVHTTYGQAVAVTGRLASNDPNLQNIPVRTAEGRRIREAFIAAPGAHIVSADYSQIELRIMAHISQDPRLLEAFAAGEDIHRATAAEIFGVAIDQVSSEQRRYVKAINFGLIYGMSSFGLAVQLGIERSAAQLYMERYFARYTGVADYMRRTRESARENGYVETVFGRKLWLPEIRGGSGPRRQAAERAAINAPMQGTAADLIKLAMIAVQNWLVESHLNSKLIMQVHDELVLEVRTEELETIQRELPGLMSNVAKLDVPLAVDLGVGPNWEQAH